MGSPVARSSLRKLATHLADNPVRRVVIGRERLRAILARNDVTFQRTKTWKETYDPLRDEKPDRIEEVIERNVDRIFAIDEFGPLALHRIGGSCWSQKVRPQRLRANFHKIVFASSTEWLDRWPDGFDALVVLPDERGAFGSGVMLEIMTLTGSCFPWPCVILGRPQASASGVG